MCAALGNMLTSIVANYHVEKRVGARHMTDVGSLFSLCYRKCIVLFVPLRGTLAQNRRLLWVGVTFRVGDLLDALVEEDFGVDRQLRIRQMVASEWFEPETEEFSVLGLHRLSSGWY